MDDESFLPSKSQLDQILEIYQKYGLVQLGGDKNHNNLVEITDDTKWEEYNWQSFYQEDPPNSAYFICHATDSFFEPFYAKILQEFKEKDKPNCSYVDTYCFGTEYFFIVSKRPLGGRMCGYPEDPFGSKFILIDMQIGNDHWAYDESQRVAELFKETYSSLIQEIEQLLNRDLKIIMDWAD